MADYSIGTNAYDDPRDPLYGKSKQDPAYMAAMRRVRPQTAIPAANTNFSLDLPRTEFVSKDKTAPSNTPMETVAPGESDQISDLRGQINTAQDKAVGGGFYGAVGRALKGFAGGAQTALSIPRGGQDPWLTGAIAGLSQAGPAFESAEAKRMAAAEPIKRRLALVQHEQDIEQAKLPGELAKEKRQQTTKMAGERQMVDYRAESRVRELKNLKDQLGDKFPSTEAIKLAEQDLFTKGTPMDQITGDAIVQRAKELAGAKPKLPGGALSPAAKPSLQDIFKP